MSYITYLKKNGDAARILLYSENILGSSSYNPNIPPKLKFLPIIYSLVLITWYTFQAVLSICIIQTRHISIPTVVLFVHKLCESLVPILVISPALFDKGTSLRCLIDEIVFSDQCLHTIGVENHYCRIKRVLMVSFLCVAVYTAALVVSILGIFVKVNDSITNFRTVTIIGIINVSHTVYTNLFIWHFCAVIVIYKYRFLRLNEEIISMFKQRFEYGTTILNVVSYDMDSLMKINTIKFVHAIYRGITMSHNQRFGHVILLQYFQSVTVITLAVYMLWCMYLNIEHFEITEICITTLLLMFIVQCLVIIVCPTTMSCIAVSCEANRMEDLVHELMSETEEEDLLLELENFSLELIHSRVVFTACDFFTIDYTLFTKIIGAVASYLVMFMQFGNTDYTELFYFTNNNTYME